MRCALQMLFANLDLLLLYSFADAFNWDLLLLWSSRKNRFAAILRMSKFLSATLVLPAKQTKTKGVTHWTDQFHTGTYLQGVK